MKKEDQKGPGWAQSKALINAHEGIAHGQHCWAAECIGVTIELARAITRVVTIAQQYIVTVEVVVPSRR